jgi:hypothetical protein
MLLRVDFLKSLHALHALKAARMLASSLIAVVALAVTVASCSSKNDDVRGGASGSAGSGASSAVADSRADSRADSLRSQLQVLGANAVAVPITGDSAAYCFLGTLSASTTTPSTAPSTAQTAPQPPIGLQGELTVNGAELSGYYRYDAVGKELSLAGRVNADGTVEIKEQFFPQNSDRLVVTGIITGTLDRAKGVITGVWANPKSGIQNKSNVTAVTRPCVLTMIARYHTKKHPTLLASVDYPVFAAPVLAALNDSLRRRMEVSYDSCVASVQRMLDELKRDSVEAFGAPWAERISFTDRLSLEFLALPSVTASTNANALNAASILVGMLHMNYMDGGGAHGTYGFTSETWALTSGETTTQTWQAWREIKLRDLFIASSDTSVNATTNYVAVLNTLLLATLKKQGASLVADGTTTDLRDIIRSESGMAWVLRPSGIRFVFSPYIVASYAEGSPEVIIPYKALQSVLRKDGVAARWR